jgi:phage-related protein
MLNVPSSIIRELYDLHRESALVFLAELPDYDIRFARNTEDIEWNGETWTKTWFEFDAIGESGEGKQPELNVTFSNIGGLVETEMIIHNNFAGATCNIYLVNSNCLDETDPVYSVSLQVQSANVTRKQVSIKLGLINPIMLSYPSWKFHGNLCQYTEFKGLLCGYSGALTTCDRTFAQCLARDNIERFGGQLGLLGEIQD